MKSLHGGCSQPAASGSQEYLQWDPEADFFEVPRHNGERQGCSDCCSSGQQKQNHLGEHESLDAFRENKKYRRELKLTVVIHRLVGIELQADEIYPPMKRERNGRTTTE